MLYLNVMKIRKTSSNKEKENELGLVNIMMHLDLVQL